MVIKLKQGNDNNTDYIYVGSGELLNKTAKIRADKIREASKEVFEEVKITQSSSKDSLKLWHRKGRLINKIIKKFSILEAEKKYFWLMLNEVSENQVPERAKKFHVQNDYRTSSILAGYSLQHLKKIGGWNIWREILSSQKTSEDNRVSNWIVEQILRRKLKTRDSARPLLKFIRNRLKKINTFVLTDNELYKKLGEYKYEQ